MSRGSAHSISLISGAFSGASSVSLKYCCYVCSKSYSEAKELREHLQKQHQLDIPGLPCGRKRRHSDQFLYVQTDISRQNVNEHYACPSCSHRYPDLDDLRQHIEGNHVQHFMPTYIDTVPSISSTTISTITTEPLQSPWMVCNVDVANVFVRYKAEVKQEASKNKFKLNCVRIISERALL